MSALTAAQTAAVAQMIEMVPDALLARLAEAVSLMHTSRAETLAQMIGLETRDRERRAIAFGPVLPLFRARADGFPAEVYPRTVLARLWKLASTPEPGLTERLDMIGTEDVVVRRIGDQFLRAAARALRESPERCWPGSGEAQRERLARLFDLAPLMRQAIERLEQWILRPDEDEVAELRVLFAKAAETHADGPERLVELIFAHLPEAPPILRILTLSAEAAAHSDVLSNSELGPFVDALLAATESRVAAVEAFVSAPARDQVRATVSAIGWCADVLREMRLTVKPEPSSAWGGRVQDMQLRIERQALAALETGAGDVETAFPLVRPKLAPKTASASPDLAAPADAPGIERAMNLLGAIDQARMTLAEFGCEGVRQATMKSVISHLAEFTEKGLLKPSEAGANGEALLRRAAEVLRAIGEKELGKAVVRRLEARRNDAGMARTGAIA
jgi:hypothetical protein